MFDSPFDFFALLIAVVAFIFARKALNQAATLRARLDAVEAAWQARPVAPALTPLQEFEQTLAAASPGIAAEQPPIVAAAEPAAPVVEDQPAVQQAAATGGPAAMPPPLPQAEPGFEERIGTRWVVWIGGLTLALGGFFMVRYSIEAGLLGPGVRTLLGGAFALALLAAGEWTRRKESVSAIEALPIANIPAILTAAGTAVAFATVYAAYALYDFLAPATAFVLLGLVALGTLAAALLHGPALAGLGVAAAFVTPILVSSEKPDFWALYIYLAIVTAAAFALARIRLWRWLAVTTIAAALLWTFPCLDCGPSMVAPHDFHVIAGFVLAALLVVCGFLFGPPAEEGRIEPISSGSLAAYLLGATIIVLASFHADAAIIVFAILVAGAVVVAWRAPSATGAVAAAAAFVFVVFAEWAVRGNPDMLVLPGGPLPGIGPVATDASVTLHLVTAAIFAARLRRRRIPGAGPLGQRDHSGGVVGFRRVHAARAVDRALCPHRPSRPLGAVCDPGRDPCRRLWRRDRNSDQTRQPAGTGDFDRAVRHGYARRAGAGADLRAGKGLAHDRAGIDVDGHGVDLDAAADPVPAFACRHSRRHRGAARRLRATHRRRCGRVHSGVQLAIVGLRRSGAVVLGRQASSCAAAATTLRCAPWRGRRCCSRCCWRSWRSVTPRTAATSTASIPRWSRSGCKSASRSPWRSAWSGCASAPAASSTM